MSASSRLDPNLLRTLGVDYKLSYDRKGSVRDSVSTGGIVPFPEYIWDHTGRDENSADRLASAPLDSSTDQVPPSSPTDQAPPNSPTALVLPTGIEILPNGLTRRYIDKKALKEMLDAVGCDNEINIHDDHTPASSVLGEYAFSGNVNANDTPAGNNTDDTPAGDINTNDTPAGKDNEGKSTRKVNTDDSSPRDINAVNAGNTLDDAKPAFSTPATNITGAAAKLFVRRPVPNPALRETGRKSPIIPRKSSRRKLQDHVRSGLSPYTKASLTKSKTGALTPQRANGSRWNTMRGQKASDSFRGLPGSKTTALDGFDDSPASPIDVGKKIEAMLAQTKALKPSPKLDSRMSRISSRVASKASGAWDRITGKKQVKDAKLRYKISRPLELTQASPHNPTIRVVDDISTIRQGISFPTMTTSDSVENYDAPVPQTPQASNSVTESSVNVSIADPFVDDTQFSADLDEVLNELPLAASTPRASRRPVRMPENSPLLEKAIAAGKDISSFEEKGLLGGFGRRELALASEFLQLPRPDFLTKKHPSPSTEDLEVLTNQLQLLGVRPKAAEAKAEGSDEEKAEAGSDVAELQIKTPPQSVKTRIPGPLGSSRSTLRFGLYKVSALGADSSEIDELA